MMCGTVNLYAIYVRKERFLLIEENIKQTVHRRDYENHFNIKL